MMGSDDGEGWVKKVMNGGAFAQKLRIETHAEIDAGALAAAVFQKGGYNSIGCSWQNGAAEHDPVITRLVSQSCANLLANILDMGEVKAAIPQVRRAHGDDGNLGVCDSLLRVGSGEHAAHRLGSR